MMTEDQLIEFDATGILKIKSLLSEQVISRARCSILSRFEPLGLSKNGEWRLKDKPRPPWPDKGYSAKQIGNKLPEVEHLINEPGIKPIVDSLLDHADLDRAFFKRPQILVTLPNDGEWFIPNDGWHVDIARLASGRRAGVQLFILLSEIKPQGGGTLVVAGSHRLLNDGGFIRPRDVTKQIRQEPGFKKLMAAPCAQSTPPSQHHNRSDAPQDPTLSIIELTGSPGDAYFMDMRALHSGAPNVHDQPRMMATHRFLRADSVPELTAGS